MGVAAELTPILLSWYRENRDVMIAAAVAFAFWAWLAVWWAGFAPAVMTPDSIDQWRMTMSGEYRNDHPFLHTLTIALTRKIWDSPAAIILLQTTLFAFAFGLSLRSLLRNGTSMLGTAAYASLFFIFPIFGIYSVTIWKDVLFSIGIFLFAIVWIDKHLCSRCIDANWKGAAATGVLVACAASMRHNGVVLAVLVPVLVLLRSDLKRRNRIALASGVAVSYLIVQAILLPGMNVSSKRMPFLRGLTVLQLVSAVAANNGIIYPDERITINAISPVNQLASRYNCYISTSTTFSNPYFDYDIFYDTAFMKDFNNAAAHILIRNVPIVVADRACMSTLMLGLGPTELGYRFETGIQPNTLGLSLSPVWRLRRPLLAYLAWSEKYPQRLLFWDYIPLLVMLFIGWRKGKSAPIRDVAIILLATTAAMCLLGPARDHRYLFPLILVTPLLFAHAVRFQCDSPRGL